MTGHIFEKLYWEKYNQFLEKSKKQSILEDLDEQKVFLDSCINKIIGGSSTQPIILGNALNRVSITALGRFPPYKYNDNYIYPVGYTCKKRCKAHREYKKNNKNKVLYICSIENDGFKIVADDGFTWAGENIWEEFSKNIGCENEYSSIEDFYSLNHPSVKALIEKLGDVSQFKGYVSS